MGEQICEAPMAECLREKAFRSWRLGLYYGTCTALPSSAVQVQLRPTHLHVTLCPSAALLQHGADLIWCLAFLHRQTEGHAQEDDRAKRLLKGKQLSKLLCFRFTVEKRQSQP